MSKLRLSAIALLCVIVSACSRSPAAPNARGNLEVFVSWQGQGLPDRQLEILELGQVKKTNALGIAVFDLQPGRYTLRAFVNRGGPAGLLDLAVVVPVGQSVRVDVTDCVPCM